MSTPAGLLGSIQSVVLHVGLAQLVDRAIGERPPALGSCQACLQLQVRARMLRLQKSTTTVYQNSEGHAPPIDHQPWSGGCVQ